MTPEEMKPEELVRYLAVDGMGYDMDRVFDVMSDGTLWMTNTDDEYETTWNPLTDANDRDMLIEAMQSDGWQIKIEWTGNKIHPNRANVLKQPDIEQHCWGKTAADALCLAAAKALMASKAGE